MIFEHLLLYWLNMNDVVTTQAYNIQAVVWCKYNILLTTALCHEIGNTQVLNWHAGVLYEQFVRYADFNLDSYTNCNSEITYVKPLCNKMALSHKMTGLISQNP